MAETGNMARSEYLFNEAEKIYKVVPGVHHPFYTEVRNYLPLISTVIITIMVLWPLGHHKRFLQPINFSAGFSTIVRAILG